MSFHSDLLGIRESVLVAVESAWPDVKLTEEGVEKGFESPFAQVTLSKVEFDFANTTSDDAKAKFEVTGVFGRPAGSTLSEQTTRIDVLRSALLSAFAAHPQAFGVIVAIADWEQRGSWGDNRIEVRLTLEVRLCVAR
ncbi:MAG: hypothetical protein R2688_06080 [Fimbriimonadaceae bacterium]